MKKMFIKLDFAIKPLLLLLMFLYCVAGSDSTRTEIKDTNKEKSAGLIEKILIHRYSIAKPLESTSHNTAKLDLSEGSDIEREGSLRIKRNYDDYFEDKNLMEGGVNPAYLPPVQLNNNFQSAIGPPSFGQQRHDNQNELETQPEFDIFPGIPATKYIDPHQPDIKSKLGEELVPPDRNENSPKDPHHTPPQFMLDLFARFENDPFTQPASNIVRSFFNQVGKNGSVAGESSKCNSGTCTRKHKLWFDVSSIPDDEHVTMAELRLYKFVEHDRRRFFGIHRKVDVFEIKKSNGHEQEERVLLDSKRIIGRTSGWETFYITNAVRRWVGHKAKKIHKLEVFIETIAHNDTSDIEFEEHPMSTNEPLLIVFSDSSDMSQSAPISQMAPYKSKLSRKQGRDRRSIKTQGKMADMIRRKILESGVKNRERRSTQAPCHLESMYVDFLSIGYKESKIVTPQGYPAGKCVGACTFPFVGNNATPYAIIKDLMHLTYPSSTPRPCCVPTRLGPISLLYYEGDALVYHYRYKDMRVLECGCR